MLVACRSFADETFGPVTRDVTRVSVDHPLAAAWPERFQLAPDSFTELGRSGRGSEMIRAHLGFGYVERSSDGPLMVGTLVPYHQEAEINTALEGHFLGFSPVLYSHPD